MSSVTQNIVELPQFNRNFWDRKFRFTRIGSGDIGGKARGLVAIKDLLASSAKLSDSDEVEISVPSLAVIATDCFDEFLTENGLREQPLESWPDQRIAMEFQRASLPPELVGDLRALSVGVKTPLAVRSSSVLEDRLERPFAGVYETKMLPNNALDADRRFHWLAEAIKFVYASTYFRKARDYIRTTGHDPRDEKMAVILQEVVGTRRGDRFYPDISGVGRSYNFYPFAPATPEERFASLALGLGKTIVDDGVSWNYSPAHPQVSPPYRSTGELLERTQTKFWAVNMGHAPVYDPVSETEFLVHATLDKAEEDGILRPLASTYDPQDDRIKPGLYARGPRIVNFAPVLQYGQIPVNDAVVYLLDAAERVTGEKVEIEFAMTIDEEQGSRRFRVGLLQVRPIMISQEDVGVSEEELTAEGAIISTDRALGNGTIEDVRDVVFVRPEKFSISFTREIAEEVAIANERLKEEKRGYVLIGFGRWGTSEPTLGIPVAWSHISGARAIVETTLPSLTVELSQASHFFHNLSSFKATYFMIQHDGGFRLDWDWLQRQEVRNEGRYVRHVRTAVPLRIRVDGKCGRGVIVAEENPRGL